MVIGNSAAGKPFEAFDGARLHERLHAFYASDHPDSGDRAKVSADKFTGLAVAQRLIAFVLTRPKGGPPSLRWRNAFVLNWARQLARDGAGDVAPLARRHIKRDVTTLLYRHRAPGDAQRALLGIFDDLQLWEAEHLTFLARGAGLMNGQAEDFVERAQPLIRPHAPTTTAMVEAIRTLREATFEQILLVILSGQANAHEVGNALFSFADRYGAAEDLSKLEFMRTGTPGRLALERMMNELMTGSAVVAEAVTDVMNMNKEHQHLGSDPDVRAKFIDLFVEASLFGPRPRVNLVSEAVPVARSEAARTTPSYVAVDNLIQFDFTCRNGLTK